MIAIDTSALMAILLDEPEADAVAAALEGGDDLTMSAATLAEALIVARRRHVGEAMAALIHGLGVAISPVDEAAAVAAAAAYNRWGRGLHPAGLNFGDCFAYALAKSAACPLLYVGADFAQTDIVSALRP